MNRALWISTTNQGKLNEFRNILGGVFEIHSVSEIPNYFAPPRQGKLLSITLALKLRL